MSNHIQFGVDWSKQHCGMRSASIDMVHKHMPDLKATRSQIPGISAWHLRGIHDAPLGWRAS